MSEFDIPPSEFLRQAGEASRLLRIMANEGRLLVLCYLAEEGELSAGELTERVGISQSALSQHLAKLREERLVTTRKEAQSVYYRIGDPKAERILALLHEIFCPELGQQPRPTGTTGDN